MARPTKIFIHDSFKLSVIFLFYSYLLYKNWEFVLLICLLITLFIIKLLESEIRAGV